DVNRQAFELCEAARGLINSVDDSPHCWIMGPAVIDRWPLVTAMASKGRSPVWSRLMRTELEALSAHSIGKPAKLSGKWRSRVKATIVNPDQRRIFWEDLYASPLKEQVFNDNMAEADRLIEQALQEWQQPKGEVYLVGAGPGDPELLTLKALRLMQQA